MSQNSQNGHPAARWGRATARRLALELGASGMFDAARNECFLDGKRVVIKCARLNTTAIGITHLMLERVDEVIGAFERNDGSFELLAMTAAQCHRLDGGGGDQTPVRRGEARMVARSRFEREGRSLGRVTLTAKKRVELPPMDSPLENSDL